MAAVVCKCLVKHGEKNVVVPFVGPWKRAQLFEYLKRERAFAGIDFGSASVTVFDEDFGLHVEVTDDFVIEDKSKLEIKEGSQYRIVDVIDLEVLPTAPQLPVPRVYTLPPVPGDVKMSIDKHTPGQYFANRRRVVEWLYYDLCSYTMYPGKLYEEAARELVTKFPSLADSTGTGYVHQEFKAITDVNLLGALKNALEPIAQKIIGSAKSKRHLEDFFKKLADEEDATPELAKDDLMLTAAIYVLPSLVKERMEAFVHIHDPEAVYVVPTVSYTGNVLQTSDFMVHLEMLELPAANLGEAIATQMALYWTFDIVFCSKTQKTFDLICRLLGIGSSGVQATPLVRVAHTFLQQ
ncbi:hypothetical protein MTO96_038541 [Rhipicephalus appendiculatus]